MAAPPPSAAAQKLDEVHDTAVRAVVPSTEVTVQLVPP
jgi:hypothetical protein